MAKKSSDGTTLTNGESILKIRAWLLLSAVFAILLGITVWFEQGQQVVDARQDLVIVELDDRIHRVDSKKVDKDDYIRAIDRIFNQLDRIEADQKEIIKLLPKVN